MQSLASNGSMISEMEECGGKKSPFSVLGPHFTFLLAYSLHCPYITTMHPSQL